MSEIIQIKQLPIIEERLKELETTIKQKTDTALSLVVTEDTFKEIKKTRAELNKEFKELEDLRKKIKSQVLKPYEDFEKVYKEVTGHYNIADRELAKRIKDVELALKDEKEQEVRLYFEEYKANLGLQYEFITYEKANLNITLTASLKSLKEKVKEFLDKSNNDIQVIKNMVHSDDLMFEYSKSLDLTNSMLIVNERKKTIEEQQKVKELAEQKEKEKQETVKKVEEVQKELAPPIIQEEKEKEYKVTFTVIGTKEKLRQLKEFLNNGGYKYE
ncbi:DUF1351 domain-containing protein [[Clostridium] colinum]|uniref:DUF1351 domain-containing protein n=1 Tax=[Clostridium] colinum TaxID=36835 RepID=UPI00202519F8|nr:DUF1351 domain-containing protein [[Clostridium] colinum]